MVFEFKHDEARLAQDKGCSVSEANRTLGVESALSRWVSQLELKCGEVTLPVKRQPLNSSVFGGWRPERIAWGGRNPY